MQRIATWVTVVLWLIPLRIIVPFLVVALYSSPETDDFCFASHDPLIALSHISQYYETVTGRLFALTLMAMPSVAADLLRIDLFAIYPLANLLMIVLFLGSMVCVSFALLRCNWSLKILFGLALAAAVLSLMISERQFIYWFTGAACYLVPTVGIAIVTAYLVGNWRERVSSLTAVALMLISLASAMCNEFSALFLIGIIAISFLFRLAFLGRKEIQAATHVALLGVTVIGFLIVLFAPGNASRMAQIHGSGKVSASLHNALVYVPEYLKWFMAQWPVQLFAVSVLCLGLAGTSPRPGDSWADALLSAVLFTLLAIWIFTSYVIGAYGTAEVLALRARNEVWAVALIVSVMAGIILLRSLIRFRMPLIIALVLSAFGALGTLGLREGRSYSITRQEWPEFIVFWRESLARNILLSTSANPDVIVPGRSVMPSTLMEEELKETPDRLPNDCVARYYGKGSVVLAPH